MIDKANILSHKPRNKGWRRKVFGREFKTVKGNKQKNKEEVSYL